MSVSDKEISAMDGLYGRPPAGFRLPAGTRLGAVRLQVSDLARSIAFYEQVLGFTVLARDERRAAMGTSPSDAPIIHLFAEAGTRAIQPGSRLGLYHFAILLPDRAALGRFIAHLSAIGARAGSSDHLVSEALYLQDPDGLGIEVYVDRPRSEWRRIDRELVMATDPLDIGDLVRAANGERWTGMPPGTVIGHVHLHVGDLSLAGAFYAEGLGFDRMVWRYPGALFLGAGGYHHHLGTNIWARGATAPSADDAQLLEWTIVLPDGAHVAALRDHVGTRGLEALSSHDDELLMQDPWGTRVRITTNG